MPSEIVDSSGEGIPFVLDGCDELPLQKQTDCLFIQLIKSSCLPKCKILITSRSSVTENIEKNCGSYISKSVEILGFLYIHNRSPKLVQIISTGFLYGHNKGFSSMNNILMRASFFLVSFIFIAHFFHGLAGAYMNLGSFSLFVYSLFV